MQCERNRPGGKKDRQEVDVRESAGRLAAGGSGLPKAQSYEHRPGRPAVDGEACCVITLVVAGEGGPGVEGGLLSCDHSRPARSSPGIPVWECLLTRELL